MKNVHLCPEPVEGREGLIWKKVYVRTETKCAGTVTMNSWGQGWGSVDLWLRSLLLNALLSTGSSRRERKSPRNGTTPIPYCEHGLVSRGYWK